MPGHNMEKLLTEYESRDLAFNSPPYYDMHHVWYNHLKGAYRRFGTTVPTDGTAGFLPGAEFIKLDAVSGATATYKNEGTVLACLFRLQGGGTNLGRILIIGIGCEYETLEDAVAGAASFVPTTSNPVTLLLTPGTITVTTPQVITDGINIIGCGPLTSIFEGNFDTLPIVSVMGDCEISDICFHNISTTGRSECVMLGGDRDSDTSVTGKRMIVRNCRFLGDSDECVFSTFGENRIEVEETELYLTGPVSERALQVWVTEGAIHRFWGVRIGVASRSPIPVSVIGAGVVEFYHCLFETFGAGCIYYDWVDAMLDILHMGTATDVRFFGCSFLEAPVFLSSSLGNAFAWTGSGAAWPPTNLFLDDTKPLPICYPSTGLAGWYYFADNYGAQGNSEPAWPIVWGDTVVDNGNITAWQVSFPYGVGTVEGCVVTPTVPNGFHYWLTDLTGGGGNPVSGLVEPVWPVVVGNSVDDNTCRWTCANIITWSTRPPVGGLTGIVGDVNAVGGGGTMIVQNCNYENMFLDPADAALVTVDAENLGDNDKTTAGPIYDTTGATVTIPATTEAIVYDGFVPGGVVTSSEYMGISGADQGGLLIPISLLPGSVITEWGVKWNVTHAGNGVVYSDLVARDDSAAVDMDWAILDHQHPTLENGTLTREAWTVNETIADGFSYAIRVVYTSDAVNDSMLVYSAHLIPDPRRL